MKTIIEKIQLDINNEISYKAIGYTVNNFLINQINDYYNSTLGAFVLENKTKLNEEELKIANFFETIDYVFEAKQQTDSDLNNLSEITNFNQL